MGDHFWPSIYPGIGVGLLYGLYLGGVANAALGALGGLIATFLGFVVVGGFLAEEGIVPLAALMVMSLAGAMATTGGLRLLRR